jgi:agmatine/peptidylarginine deiminase
VPEPLPELLRTNLPMQRGLLRGDYEPPEVLVVVYDTDWVAPLEQIVQVARQEVSVLVMGMELDDPQLVADWARQVGAPLLPFVVDTPWVRDFAPFQRKLPGGDVLWLDFSYSPQRARDDVFPAFLAQTLNVTHAPSVIPLDGGAVVSNGEGVCAITERSLRETLVDLDAAEARELLLEELGCRDLAVVPALAEEETGHVDMFVQFTRHDRAVVASIDPIAEPQAAAVFEETTARLKRAAEVLGLALEIERVPMVIREGRFFSYINGTRLPASYLVPSYVSVDPWIELEAHAALARSMPGVKLVPVGADRMIDRAGAIHCLTSGVWLPSPKPAPLLVRRAKRPKRTRRRG